MKLRIYFALLGLIGTSLVKAGPITDWRSFRSTRVTSLSGQGSSNPVFGDVNLPSSSAFLVGYFDPISLTNVGDRITLSFQVSFTDAEGMSNSDDQFRFGVFDLNNQPRIAEKESNAAGVSGYTDQWWGYWAGIDGAQKGPGGSIRKRTQPNLHPIANAGSVSIGAPEGQPVIFTSAPGVNGGPLYSGQLTVQRTPVGISLNGFFGGNGTTNTFATMDPAPMAKMIGAIAFLNGAASNCDQFNFQQVTIVREASKGLRIVTDPSSTTGRIGEKVIFQVMWEGGAGNHTVEWRENGMRIIGATNQVLSFPVKTRRQHNNVYSATVSNTLGHRVTSAEAVLTVLE